MPYSSTLDDMHFLCALDGSAGGRHAAHVAAHFANRLHADMTLLRVVSEHDDAARPELERFVKTIELSCGVRPTVRVESGHPTATLLAAARTMAADLLVIGEARDRVVHESPCPVLVVPTAAPVPLSHDVALVHDGSESSREAAEVAGRLAACLGTKLTVIHVLRDPRSVTQPVRQLLRRAVDNVEAGTEGADLQIAHAVAYRRPAADFRVTMARLRPAVVVAGAPRPTWRDFLHTSIPQLLRRSAQPSLLVPAGASIAPKAGVHELEQAA